MERTFDLSGFRKGNSLSPLKITNIFLGIDFGTSFTKVSYSYAPTQTPQIETIKWNDALDGDFFKPTVLYIQNERLYFDKPAGDFKEVKYFKYSILETKLKNNSERTKNNFEEICCVYFLAQVLKRSLAIIQEKLHIENMGNIKISVNMGVPLENFYEEKNKNNMGLYQEILEDAVLLAGGCKVKTILPENQVLISNLDSVFSEIEIKRAIPNWSVNVYPELAAELLLYHQSKFVADGFYAVIDIGGGTVDMALFQKKTNILTKMPEMNCLDQKIFPYGIEILKKAFETISEKQFRQGFASMLVGARLHFINENIINVFFLGGGANEKWYFNNIKNTYIEHKLNRAGIPELNFSIDLEDFIKSEEKILQKNQRLIISQMLARHKNEIEDVKGFPNFYKSIQPKKSPDNDPNNDKGKNSGWDDNEH